LTPARRKEAHPPYRYTEVVTTVSEKEERLLESLRKLPPEAADRVIDWAEQLAALANGGPVQWSDTWTHEDMADARGAAMRNLDEEESRPE